MALHFRLSRLFLKGKMERQKEKPSQKKGGKKQTVVRLKWYTGTPFFLFFFSCVI